MKYNKLKQARLSLNLSQGEIAERSGITQRDVSQLEAGKKTFVPTSYIQFLNISGIDLNVLFSDDENVSFNEFDSVNDPAAPYNVKLIPGPCQQCNLRERLLEAKEETINSLRAQIKMLLK